MAAEPPIEMTICPLSRLLMGFTHPEAFGCAFTSLLCCPFEAYMRSYRIIDSLYTRPGTRPTPTC